MSKELVISANRHETKVALIEDDLLCEVYFQRANEYSLAGSIHKGRVTRVLPGMQSAFVDLGLERDTFLYVSDFLEEHEDFDKVTGDERPVREAREPRESRDREPREPGRVGRDRRSGSENAGLRRVLLRNPLWRRPLNRARPGWKLPQSCRRACFRIEARRSGPGSGWRSRSARTPFPAAQDGRPRFSRFEVRAGWRGAASLQSSVGGERAGKGSRRACRDRGTSRDR